MCVEGEFPHMLTICVVSLKVFWGVQELLWVYGGLAVWACLLPLVRPWLSYSVGQAVPDRVSLWLHHLHGLLHHLSPSAGALQRRQAWSARDQVCPQANTWCCLVLLILKSTFSSRLFSLFLLLLCIVLVGIFVCLFVCLFFVVITSPLCVQARADDPSSVGLYIFRRQCARMWYFYGCSQVSACELDCVLTQHWIQNPWAC